MPKILIKELYTNINCITRFSHVTLFLDKLFFKTEYHQQKLAHIHWYHLIKPQNLKITDLLTCY